MTLNSTLSSLMNSARSITGITDKLSINDLINYLPGLYPINYIDNPSEDNLTIKTDNGIYGTCPYSATLPVGIYCFSAYIVSNSSSLVCGRVEFTGDGGRVNNIGSSHNDWGIAGNHTINGGYTGIMTMEFEVVKAGKFNIGYSGYPWTGGVLVVNKPMINRGLYPLPFTKNHLGGGVTSLLLYNALLILRGCIA